jgi:diadenosine tetraphosphate (Ap4A) HIT family hydrolase
VLVAPREHREDVVLDFTRSEYLDLQDVVRRVAIAVRQVVECERVYILSLGSQQGNAHVHWHIVPCSPGLPFQAQQLNLMRVEDHGYIDLGGTEMKALGDRLRGALQG